MTVQFTTLFSFTGYNGSEPVAGLTADANGDLFGTTESSSAGYGNDTGTVFEIQNTGTVTAPVYASAPTTLAYIDGDPKGGLTADANGNLFGTTLGTVFEVKNTGTVAAPIYDSFPITLVSLASLASVDGYNVANAYAGLTADANGNLFGTTSQGGVGGVGVGVGGAGTVFEIQNTGTVAAPVYASTPITLVSFDGSNGAYPSFGRLIADANGDLFGTTEEGGADNKGVVFEIQNTGTVAAPVYASTPTTLVSFNGSNGANPIAGLTADANGDLFGTTESGGLNGDGTVFEMKNTGTVAAPIYDSAPITLVSFDGSSGANPYAGLIADANGDLFGTTEEGGADNKGVVFEIQNTGTVAAPVYASAPTTLVSFNGSNGANPYGGLTADANGNLFGTTWGGGLSDYGSYGTVFEITGAFVVAPTISGTVGGQATTSETPVKPFARATIGDANAGATDTLTITLGGAGGTLADGAGFNGLTPAGAGVYTLSGTAAAITSELDALVFTPTAGAPNTSSTTTFTLSDQSSAGGAPAVDSTTSVIDSDPPLPPAPLAITSASYVGSGASGHWSLGGTGEVGTTIRAYNGANQLVGTAVVNGSGVWAFPTTLNNTATRDFTVTATDAAGNTSAHSTAYYEGTPSNNVFNFASEATLSAAALINGGLGTDTVQMTSPATLTDADFAHFQSIELLGLNGASSVTLGPNANADGLGTVIVGNGNTSVTDSNATTLTVNASALGAGHVLTLIGSAPETVTNLAANVDATNLSGALSVTTAAKSLSIATGSGAAAINAAALGGNQTLTLTGGGAATVTGLIGNLTATNETGPLTVTTTGGNQTVTTGSGPIAITDKSTGLTVNTGTGTLTLAGAKKATIKVGGNLAAGNDTGALTVTATGTASHTIGTGSAADTITATHGGDTIAGGGGGDKITVTGHSVADTFAYAATSDSANTSGGHDAITGFTASGTFHDLLDFSPLNPLLSMQGALPSSGGSVQAHSIAWLYLGGNAMVYVNDTSSALSTSGIGSSNLMEVTLNGVSTGLTSQNFKA